MNVLVVAAHPDDELLGCGGTLLRHVHDGDRVALCLVGTRGNGGRAGRDAERRKEQALTVAKRLGAGEPAFLDYEDSALESVPVLRITQDVERVVADVRPEVVYTHSGFDLNVDHLVCRRAALTACRPLPGSSVRRLLSFEVLSSTEWTAEPRGSFVPNAFVDVSGFLEAKMELLRLYEDEMRPAPHSRCHEHVRVLARHRGLSVGVDYAEAFVVERWIR